MIVKWTNEFKQYFDLDQAEEDFRHIFDWNPYADPDRAIYDAVHENFIFDGEEYIDIQPAIEICAKALRERVVGVQMRMDFRPETKEKPLSVERKTYLA